MREAAGRYDIELSQYTDVVLPRQGENALDTADRAGSVAARERVEVPLRDGDAPAADPGAPRFAGSPYARTERLARRLTADAPTAYDAVRAVQDHFRSAEFSYSERPPSRRYPLNAFLFQDKIGYCQQFSGAMALMLRMSGIPARVATGFSPGSLNRDTGEYRVRDLDAHSWVEVYFNGIGWVTFDPTPPAAPADRAGQGPRAAPEGEDRPRDALSSDGDSPLSDRAADTGAACRGGGGGQGGGPPAGVLVGIALAALAGGAGVPAGPAAPPPPRDRGGRAGRAGAGAAAAGLEAARRAPRCCSSSSGCSGPRGPPPPATCASCARCASARARARRRPGATGARCAAS